jgi:hypothetical protein
MNDNLECIRNNLNKITQEEYNKYGYEPQKTEAKQLNDKIKEKEINIEINKMTGKINKMIQKKEFKSNIYIEKKDSVSDIMDNTSDMFNILENTEEYLDWRKLSIDDKLKSLDIFFEAENTDYDISFTDEIKDELRELVNNKKLLYKKDILYDKINKRILSIPLLKYQDGKFILKEDVKKVNVKKSNLNNINKLLKKN